MDRFLVFWKPCEFFWLARCLVMVRLSRPLDVLISSYELVFFIKALIVKCEMQCTITKKKKFLLLLYQKLVIVFYVWFPFSNFAHAQVSYWRQSNLPSTLFSTNTPRNNTTVRAAREFPLFFSASLSCDHP